MRTYGYRRTNLQIRAFYIFATDVLSYMYWRSPFITFLSDGFLFMSVFVRVIAQPQASFTLSNSCLNEIDSRKQC